MTAFTPQQVAYAASISQQFASGNAPRWGCVGHLSDRYSLSREEAEALYVLGEARRKAAGETARPGPRTLLSTDRGEVAAALLEHLDGDEDTVTGLLDLAELEGDAQVYAVTLAYDGTTWLADLFTPLAKAA